MKQRNAVHLLYSVLIGLGCILGTYVPVLLFIIPGFLAFTGIAWGRSAFVLAAIVSCAGAFFSMDTVSALLFISIYLPAAAVLAGMVKKQSAWRETALYASALMCLGFYLFLCLPSLMEGEPPFSEVLTTIGRMNTEITESFRSTGADSGLVQEFTDNLKLIESFIPKVALSFMLTAGMLGCFFSTIIAKGLSRAAGVPLRPMAKFEMWQLPRGFLWGSIFMFAVALIGMLSGYSGFDAVYIAVQAVVLGPLAFQGLSFEYYLLGRRKNASMARSILFLALVLLFPFSIAVLALLGMLEQMIRLRIKLKDHFSQ